MPTCCWLPWGVGDDKVGFEWEDVAHLEDIEWGANDSVAGLAKVLRDRMLV